MDLERLYTRSAPVIETRADGKKVLSGYASVFYRAEDPGTEFKLWGDVYERIMPTAFDRALKDGDDVRAVFNHSVMVVLGRTKSATCRLTVDARGLRYEVDLPDTQAARDLAELIARGDIDGSSFAFLPDDEGGVLWREEATRDVREVHSVRLYDVGPVTFPAYESTSCQVRARSEYDVYAANRQREIDKVDVFSKVASLP
jgi:uncharacterized protein